MKTITPAQIEEIGRCNITLGSKDMVAIYKAADGDPFLLIGYAYALGFVRGSEK